MLLNTKSTRPILIKGMHAIKFTWSGVTDGISDGMLPLKHANNHSSTIGAQYQTRHSTIAMDYCPQLQSKSIFNLASNNIAY